MVIPANLIYFKVLVDDPGPLELRDASGAIVPASIRQMGPDRVFAPDTPPGPHQTMTLEYHDVCPPGTQLPAQPRLRYRFFVGPTRQLELREPQLSAIEKGIALPNGRFSHEGVFVRYEYFPPVWDETNTHLVDRIATIDGRPFGLAPESRVLSRCNPPDPEWRLTSCGGVHFVPPGVHELEIRTRIVGVDKEYVNRLTVDTSCDQQFKPARTPDAAAGVDADSADAGSVDGPPTQEPTSTACALAADVGRSPGHLSLVPLLLGALIWLGLRRRQGL